MEFSVHGALDLYFWRLNWNYWSGSFVLILKSLLFTFQFLLRAAVNINSGIPSLCLEFLLFVCYSRGVYKRVLSHFPLCIYTKKTLESSFSSTPLLLEVLQASIADQFRLDWDCWNLLRNQLFRPDSPPQSNLHFSRSAGIAAWPGSKTCSWFLLASVFLPHIWFNLSLGSRGTISAHVCSLCWLLHCG